MAKKAFLKDHDDIEILPITRGELVLDSSGNPAFSSNEFLATTSQPGLMSKEDKSKIDNLSSIGELSDEKVKQIATTTNASYRLLFSGTADDTTRIEYTGKSSKLLYNPSTGSLTSTKFVGDLAGTAASATRTKYIETMTYTGESWYGDRYKLYAQWFNGTICDWKSTDDTNNEYQVRVDIAKKLNTPHLLWGNNFDGTQNLSGTIVLTNNNHIRIKDTLGADCSVVGMTDGNNLMVGGDMISGTRKYNTFIYGYNIYFRTGTNQTAMTITDGGNVLVGVASQTNTDFKFEVSGLSRIYTAGQSMSLGKVPTSGLVLGSSTGLQGQFYFDYSGSLCLQGQNVSDSTVRALNLNPLGGAVNVGGNLAPNANNSLSLGISSSRWSNVYSVNGNFSGTITGNLDGTYVDKLTGYTKATAISALAATDTLNTALGKLEYKADVAYNLVKGAYDGDGTIENLAEILKVLEGISDTETIQAIVGKYLPLTGGVMELDSSESFMIKRKTESGSTIIKFANNNGTLGYLGVDSTAPVYYNAKGNKFTIIHSGNVGDYALKIDGTNGMNYGVNITWGDENKNQEDYEGYSSGFRLLHYNTSSKDYRGGIHVGTRYGWQLVREANTERMYVRYIDPSTKIWSDWKTIAFTDSDITGNAATATALKNKVSLWGNKFDGTQSLDGNITIRNQGTVSFAIADGTSVVDAIQVNISDSLLIGQGVAKNSGNTLVYGNNIKFCYGSTGSSSQTAMTITEKGNVGIGNTTPIAPLTVAPKVNGTMELGTTNGIVFAIQDQYKAYGINFNVESTGKGNIQVGRTTGEAKSFALNLNPLGGAVNIGSADAPTNVFGELKVGSGTLGYINMIGSGVNYLWAATTTHIGLSTVGGRSGDNATLTIKNDSIHSGFRNDAVSLGTSSYRWSNVYSVNGNFSNAVMVGSTILGIKPADGTYNRWKITSSTGGLYIQSSSYNGQYATGIINMTGYNDNNLTSFNVKSVLSTFSGKILIGTTEDNGAKLQVNGQVFASGFMRSGSSDSYVLLGGGGHKAISDFLLKSDIANQELNNNLTTITKSLTVTADWMDTGIDGDDLPTGTYIVQVSCAANTGLFYDCYWSGVMGWWKGRTNDTESDEIILHRVSRQHSATIYLRTLSRSNTDTNGLKLQIAASQNIGAAYTYTFKFKRVI